MAQPNTTIETKLPRRLTAKEQEKVLDALELIKQADPRSLASLCENEEGEDERIASVQAIHRLLGQYVNVTVEQIVDERDHCLREAKDATTDEDRHKFYYSALHCEATTYHVDSHQGYEHVLPWKNCEYILKDETNGKTITNKSQYLDALAAIVDRII